MISHFPPCGERPFGDFFRLDLLSRRTDLPPAMTTRRAPFIQGVA